MALQLQDYVDGFRHNYEKFLIGCDAMEEERLWNKEKLGEMDAYFANEILCVIVRLIASDGTIVPDEVDYLNRALGFDYTVNELHAVYEENGEQINRMFDRKIEASVKVLRAARPDIADSYVAMLQSIRDIIIASDEVITEEEKRDAEQLKKQISF